MSTGAIVAIVVGVAVVLGLLAWLVPRLRRTQLERELQRRRGTAVEHHREEAEGRRLRAETAEREAQRERAEAELHESRAAMHERGMADHELAGDGDMPPAREETRREVEPREGPAR
jgi:C4-dicarboxylate-specific signal transduction histidine kinase